MKMFFIRRGILLNRADNLSASGGKSCFEDGLKLFSVGERAMGYFYLLLVALMFSLGGTSVKLIRPYFAPSMITLMRFAVGVFWLLLL